MAAVPHGYRDGDKQQGLAPSTRDEPVATGARRRGQEKCTQSGLERSDRLKRFFQMPESLRSEEEHAEQCAVVSHVDQNTG